MATFEQTQDIITKINPKTAMLLKGDSGKGKSSCVKQAAKKLNIKVIDKRLSQMLEGDLMGLPKIVNNQTVTTRPDWFELACDEPAMLFFDELNRAAPSVQQGVFEIILDRTLLGRTLHPDTKVISAVNDGDDYIVNEMDPALQRRFLSLDFEPTKDEFLAYAKDNLSPYIVDFLAANKNYIESYEGSGVLPDRRKWEFVNDSPELIDNKEFLSGLVGEDVANAFLLHRRNNIISWSTVREDFDKLSKKKFTKKYSNLSAIKQSQVQSQAQLCKDLDIDDLECFSIILSDEHMLNMITNHSDIYNKIGKSGKTVLSECKDTKEELYNRIINIVAGGE